MKTFFPVFFAILAAVAVIALVIKIKVESEGEQEMKAIQTRQKNSCIANLKGIEWAIQQWALENKKSGTEPVSASDILGYLKGSVLPLCPNTVGSYRFSTVSTGPVCTLSTLGHSL